LEDSIESGSDDDKIVKSPILRKLRTSSRTKNAPKYTFDDDDDDDDEEDEDTLNGISDKDNDFEETSLPPLKNKNKITSVFEETKKQETDEKDSIIEDDDIKGDDLNVEVIDIDKNIKTLKEIKEKSSDDNIVITLNDNNGKNDDIEMINDDDDLSVQSISSSSTLKQKEIKSSPKKEFISRIASMKTKKRPNILDSEEKEKNKKVEEITTTSKPSRSRISRTTSKRRAKARDIQYLELSDDD